MRSKKLTALLMTTALCATALFGCGDSSSDPTTKGNSSNNDATTADPANEEKITATLKVAAPAEDQQDANNWLKTQCENFNAEHPNWDLTFEYVVLGEDKGSEIAQDPSAGPDVYMFASDQIKTLLDAHAIMEFIGDNAQYVKDTNSEQIVNNVTYNGAIYGIPYTANNWYMFYDKSVYSEEDVKNLNTMLEKGKVALPISTAWYTECFFLAAGCTVGDDDNPGINFAGDAGVKAATYMISLGANPNFTDASGVSGLGDQFSAMFSGSWDLANAREALGDNLGIAVKPEITFEDGTTGQLRGFASAKAIGVNPNCQYQQVAVALAKFLAGEEAQKARYELRGVIPCNTALQEDEAIKNDEAFIAQNGAYEQDIIQPAFLGDTGYWDEAAAFGKAVLPGAEDGVTLDNVADKVELFNTTMNDKLALALGN